MSFHFSNLPKSLAALAFPLDLAAGLKNNSLVVLLKHCHLSPI